MKISTRIIIFCVVFSVVAILVAGSLVAWRASALSTASLVEKAQRQLISVRELKKNEVEEYFKTVADQLLAFADDSMTVAAADDFTKAYQEIEQVGAELIGSQTGLEEFYRSSFGTKYRAENSGSNANEMQRYGQLSQVATVLQTWYISDNPNPLGQKNNLAKIKSDMSYGKYHEKYHHHINKFLNVFEFYDIFIVDLKGRVVYSVYKELDFATDLTKGPYANSGLARAFNRALNGGKDKVYIEDFSPYYPSYEASASFISTPIYAHNQDYSHNEMSGVLIFQMPLDRIRNMMNYKGRWQDVGLGNTGETYLVGHDGLLRSEHRLLHEDKAAYIAALSKGGLSKQVVDKVAAGGSGIGIVPVRLASAEQAVAGKSGLINVTDYRGRHILSAYAPISVLGLQWGLLSEIDETEALADAVTLEREVWLTLLKTLGLLLIIVIISGYFLGMSISKPIINFIAEIEHLSDTKNLTLRLKDKGNDELARLGASLNQLFSEIQKIVLGFNQVSKDILTTSNTITDNMAENMASTRSQSMNADSASTAINELSASVKEVARFAEQTAHSVVAANDTGLASADKAKQLGMEIAKLNQQMQLATQSINDLAKESESIASVLDVIQGVAEQTNLLALNAAIEAARAGEQGRGFAVVADEVRTLASRTQSSTEDIRSKIDSLQAGTHKAVELVNDAGDMANKGIQVCQENDEMLQKIVVMLKELNDMNVQIATAATQQSCVTEELNTNSVDIASASVAISEKTEKTADLMQQLMEKAKQLQQAVKVFKL